MNIRLVESICDRCSEKRGGWSGLCDPMLAWAFWELTIDETREEVHCQIVPPRCPYLLEHAVSGGDQEL